MGAYWLQVPGTYQRSNETEAGPQLAAVQRNTRELSRDEEAYFSEATGACTLFPMVAEARGRLWCLVSRCVLR